MFLLLRSSVWFKLNHHYVKCFSKFREVKSGNFNFSSYQRKTSVEKMAGIRKWRLYFHVSNLEWAQQEGDGSFDLYSNEKYTGEIGFLFHFREWISWWQIVLYHLVALISSSERQELFFITKTHRNFHTSSPLPLHGAAATISISVSAFKQSPRGHLRHFSPVLIYTWKEITYQRSCALKWKEKLFLLYVPDVGLILPLRARGDDVCRCNWVQSVCAPIKNSATYTVGLIRLQRLMGENTVHCRIQRGNDNEAFEENPGSGLIQKNVF